MSTSNSNTLPEQTPKGLLNNYKLVLNDDKTLAAFGLAKSEAYNYGRRKNNYRNEPLTRRSTGLVAEGCVSAVTSAFIKGVVGSDYYEIAGEDAEGEAHDPENGVISGKYYSAVWSIVNNRWRETFRKAFILGYLDNRGEAWLLDL